MKHLPFTLASIASLVLLIASLIDSHPVDLATTNSGEAKVSMINLHSAKDDGHLRGNTRITREKGEEGEGEVEEDARGERKKHPQMANRSNSSASQGRDETQPSDQLMSLPSEPVQVSTFHFKVKSGSQEEQEHHHHQQKSQEQLHHRRQQEQQVEEAVATAGEDVVESKFKKEILPSSGQNNELRIPVFITKDASKVIALSRLYTDAFKKKYDQKLHQASSSPSLASGMQEPNLQHLNEIPHQESQEQNLHLTQSYPYTHHHPLHPHPHFNHAPDDGFIGMASEYTGREAIAVQDTPFDRDEDEQQQSTNYPRARVNFDTLHEQLEEPIASGSEEQGAISCPFRRAPGNSKLVSLDAANSLVAAAFGADGHEDNYHHLITNSPGAGESAVNSFFSNSLEPSEANHYETWAYPSPTFVNLAAKKLQQGKNSNNNHQKEEDTSEVEVKKHVARNYMSKALNTYFNFILEFQKQRGWPRF